MVLRENYIISTNPLTFGEVIDLQKAQTGDVQALADLLASRTDLTMSEVRALTIPELNLVCIKVAEGVELANTLAAIQIILNGSKSSGD